MDIFHSRLYDKSMKDVFGIDLPSHGWQTAKLHSKVGVSLATFIHVRLVCSLIPSDPAIGKRSADVYDADRCWGFISSRNHIFALGLCEVHAASGQKTSHYRIIATTGARYEQVSQLTLVMVISFMPQYDLSIG